MSFNILGGTKRKEYSTERVRKMRMERTLIKAKKDGVSDSQVQHYLGKLQAAGHMKMNGFRSMKVEQDVVKDTITNELGGVTKNIKVEYQLYNQTGMDDRPHFDGYLRSASEVDKKYKLKGWFNEDGTIRIELVN
jgi:poly-beta-hydroxyalkanoate depolymerase